MNGQIQVAGDQWPVFLYANYMYDPEDPWNGLLWSGLLVLVRIALYIIVTTVTSHPILCTPSRVYTQPCSP